MNMSEEAIREFLINNDENFKVLALKHQEYDQRLKVLADITFKTDEEIIEERNLKKEKLKAKDSMQKYIFDYKKNAAL
ncbi:MAG: hypothetical protein ACM3SY_15665 [Candidatus Omnitrophota bacterium]